METDEIEEDHPSKSAKMEEEMVIYNFYFSFQILILGIEHEMNYLYIKNDQKVN